MKRVLHIITTIERGGAENQLALLAKLQAKTGRLVYVMPLKGELTLRSDLEKSGIVIIDLTKLSFLRQIFAIRVLLKEEIILHSHLPRAELLVRCASIGLQIDWFISRHNSEKFWPGVPNAFSKFLSRYVINKARKVICISNGVLSFLKTTGEVSMNNYHKLEVIHYAHPIAKEIKIQNIESSSFKFRIGIAARLEEQKDLPTLLLAFSEVLKDSKDDWTLYIAGAGSLESKLKRRASELDLESKVHWLGKLEDMESFYSNIDIFVLTSRYEGFGLVLLEAISRKIPVICSDIPTAREILGDDYLGLFPVENAEKLKEKILRMSNSSLREEFCKHYPEIQDKFEAKSMEKHIRRLYESQ